MGDVGTMEGYLLAPERQKAGRGLLVQCVKGGDGGRLRSWRLEAHNAPARIVRVPYHSSILVVGSRWRRCSTP